MIRVSDSATAHGASDFIDMRAGPQYYTYPQPRQRGDIKIGHVLSTIQAGSAA